jgi:hypothetical protein
MGRTELEKQSLETAERYLELYNTTPEQFVKLYTEDCLIGDAIRGRDNLYKIESSYHSYAPNRKMRLDRMLVDGEVVPVQGRIKNADWGEDWEVPFCAILTCRDGMITEDYTYAEFSKLTSKD